ncbi:MAG: TlpA family protein disulfide reductase [Firmicutes bacterium]|nr:TlpA family protein disulfide reductase [Alicyclobacillaceae bacterium]MCL6497465.1 TlpA family protein disulfide reductase [Bacillota bacterium]
MNQRLRRWVNIAILGAAALAVAWILKPVWMPTAPPRASALPHAVSVTAPLSVGQPAPAFALETAEGTTVSLAALRGRPVILNFWATWCPWCKQELPAFESVKRRYGSRIALYGVDIQESPSTVRAWLRHHRLDYPVLLDTTGGVAAAYAVEAVPTTVFIGPDGRIAAIHTGAFSGASAILPYVREAMGAGGR